MAPDQGVFFIYIICGGFIRGVCGGGYWILHKRKPTFEGICLVKQCTQGEIHLGVHCWQDEKQENGKDQESIQSRTTPDPGYHMEK